MLILTLFPSDSPSHPMHPSKVVHHQILQTGFQGYLELYHSYNKRKQKYCFLQWNKNQIEANVVRKY